MNILKGEQGHKRNAVLLNAGAALYIGGKAETMKDGVALAAELIDSGKALKTLERLIEVSNRPGGRGMNILDQLADYARERVARDKAQVALETLKAQALALPVGAFAFEQAPGQA